VDWFPYPYHFGTYIGRNKYTQLDGRVCYLCLPFKCPFSTIEFQNHTIKRVKRQTINGGFKHYYSKIESKVFAAVNENSLMWK
jgi:hypothetical protein